jgi:DNA-binding NtrC family response regulator
VLQEREFQRLGSSETIRVDVRVVAACNADLDLEAREGRFREDLYYRLNVIPIEIPPLRERLEDVPLLVRHFTGKVAEREGMPVKRVTREALERLMRYRWPGNVRQLENAVEMAMILSGGREVLFPADFRLPADTAGQRSNVTRMPSISVPDHGLDFERTVGEIERTILQEALRKTNGNKKQAADMLGLKRTTLAAKLKSLEAPAV